MRQTRLQIAIRTAKQSKMQARALLDTGNNRMWLSLSVVLWLITAGAIYMLCAGLVYAADESIFTDQPSALAVGLTVLSYALMALSAFALLLPMTGGMMLLARRIYEGKVPEVRDLFAAFDSPKRYLCCLGLGFYGLLRPVLTLLILLLGCVAAPSVTAQIMRDAGAISVLIWLACAGVLALGVAAALAVMIAFRATCLKAALLSRGMPWHEACLRVREMLAKNRAFPFYYRLSFAGHAALCVLTIGVSAVIDGIGHALLCHQYACDAFETREK